MNNSKIGAKEIEYIESDDEELNDAAFAEVQSTFKDLVRTAKIQLYECIVKRPPITSEKAQDNQLLIDYLTKLNLLYQLCDGVNTSTLSATKVEKKLSTFPLQTQETIKLLLRWLTDFFNKNQYVDTIPYSDYLDVQFRRYPFLQK
jgi:hypothetical protein